jgi:hypothetical protein
MKALNTTAHRLSGVRLAGRPVERRNSASRERLTMRVRMARWYGVPLEEVDRSLVGKSPANYREERA